MLGGGRGRGAERKSCGGPCTVCNILLLGLTATVRQPWREGNAYPDRRRHGVLRTPYADAG